MTTTRIEGEELAQLERYLNGVAPAGSGNPVPPPGTRLPSYMTAEQHLSDALEGTAPALARHIAEHLSKPKALELADAIRRAVDRAVRKQVDVETATRLAALAGVVEAGLDGIPAECETPEGMAPWEPHEPAPEPPPAPPMPERCESCGGDLRWDEGMGVWKTPNMLGWTDQCPPSADRYHSPAVDRG